MLFSPKFAKVAGESREVVWRWGSGGARRVVVGACLVESGRGMRLAVTSTQVGGETRQLATSWGWIGTRLSSRPPSFQL